MRELLAKAAVYASDYLDALPERSVCALPGAAEALVRALDTPLPEQRSDTAEVLDFLNRLGGPATTASAGGRYFGFVTGGSLPASLASHVLASAWDQNAFGWVSSPAAAAFEETALRWIKQALGIPPSVEGALTTGATMAHFACLAAARNRVLTDAGWDVEANGLFGAPEITVVVGEEAHASLFKVLSMLGFGRARVVRLPVDEQGCVTGAGLPEIKAPAIVCIQAGNVNSGGFDKARPVVEWARRAGAWIHVDGAFGLWALASPDLKALAEDFLDADSWALDGHKWLNVPYDSGIALVADTEALTAAMSITGAYLLKTTRRDALDVTPDSSRRARGIDIWAALCSLGRTGLAELIDRNCRQARQVADGLRAADLEILNDVVLNQVVVSFGDADATEKLVERVQQSGECWCGGTVWRGRSAMRISVSSWATTDEDIDRSIVAIVEAARAVSA